MRDTWTPLAMAAGIVCVLIATILDRTSPAVLIKPAPLILVFGGTFFAGTAGLFRRDLHGLGAILRRALTSRVDDLEIAVEQMAFLAATAKQNGIMALDQATATIADPFLRRGVELAVDGVSSEELVAVLEDDLESTAARHRAGAKVFADMGGYAPTLGIIGTVMGLVHVLGNLAAPGSLGPAIGSAFTATLWGVLSANLIWIPLVNKLRRLSDLEIVVKRMEIEGLLAIQVGASSRMVRRRMESFLAPALRNEPASGAAA
ncbi:MAG: MotA/TolQ/ExbB proton channel family protein [Actinomycetota bacterium]|nr:MotA/TolQ/ExbB proton channel family protein [Actinomycetota bacterium]